ncbi:MAG: T9SS type A sorting domain-containing protein [Bacteroidetes bacterium]|nr:T9SS type A sorting domain-containing protein [Bacteroidota bacterium]
MSVYLLIKKMMKPSWCFLFCCISNVLVAQVYNNGNMYISGNVYVQGNIQNTSGASYLNNGTFYLDGSFTNDQAAMVAGTLTSSGTLILQGNTTPTVLNGSQDFNFHNLTLSKTTTTNLVNMSRSVITKNNLTLVKGIITTGTNLFTWEKGGAISMPGTGLGESGSGLFTDSYIATCDAAGTPITNGASAYTPFLGTQGFRINNVTNTDTYFPVGASYLPALSAGTPSPNRMMLNNQLGASANYTVIVNIGDIGKTVVNGVSTTWHVNRIWYVNTSTAQQKGKANMRLFFTKRTTGSYPTTQNEVELPGFDYTLCALVQKNFEPLNNGFLSLAQGSDIINNIGAGSNTEVYGQYTIGVSPHSNGMATGIDSFTRFSVVNPGAIVLPVTITDLKAAVNGPTVDLSWTSLNEINIDKYDVERSGDAINYTAIGNVKARNNNQPENKYTFTDLKPLNGANFYRVKVWGKDGTGSYTNVVHIQFSDNHSNGFRVYPNPVQNKHFTLDMNQMAAGKYTLILTSINGQRVYEKTFDYTGGIQSMNFELPRSIAAGTYHLLLMNGNFTGRIKLIVD